MKSTVLENLNKVNDRIDLAIQKIEKQNRQIDSAISFIESHSSANGCVALTRTERDCLFQILKGGEK